MHRSDRLLRCFPRGLLALAGALAGCAGVSPHVGVGVPVGPVSVGVGVGVNQRGQVTGSAGVGVSTPIGGGAQVGVGVGGSRVLHDPAAPPQQPSPSVVPGQVVPATPGAPIEWRDAQGQVVPACRVQGGC